MVNVQQGIDPVVTSLVVGTPSMSNFPTLQLIRPITVPKWSFQYTTFGVEHLMKHDTERGMRAEIKHSDWESGTDTGKLRRFGWSIGKDQDEIGNANPSLRLRERSAAQAREIVLRDIETRMKDFVLAATSYQTGHVTTLTATNEWDNQTNGDSRANVRALAKLIFTATQIPYDRLSVFLTEESLQAALDDPKLKAIRNNFSSDTPDIEVLRRYWGVGRVWSANPSALSAADALESMYGDIAVVYFDGNHADFDTEYGEYTWAVQFSWNQGVANAAWYEDKRTTWFFPWHEYRSWKAININCAGLILNTAA
jgi:hypothetical protein